jgi:hypothetical protein
MYLEVKPKSGDNSEGADTAAALSAYYARKRSVGLRAVMLLVPMAALAAIWSPVLGFDLLLGGMCGIGNMWLVMRNNERLLDGRRSRGVYGATNLARILGVGFAPVVSAMTGPWWSMGIALAGFFTPLVLYAFALRREFSTG